MTHAYTITPRLLEVGGGWRLRLLEDGEEVGGGAFPLAAFDGAADPQQAAFDDAEAEGQS